jgi:hypothetical protein
VNKTIQRSTAKAIALHGLGLSLWMGEDIADVAPAVQPTSEQLPLKVGDDNWEKVAKYIEANKGLGADAIIKNLEVKYKITAQVKTAINKICA